MVSSSSCRLRVHQPEHLRQQDGEGTQQNQQPRREALLQRRQHTAIGKDRQHHEEVETAQALLGIQLEMRPDKLSTIHAITLC
jgi:hypothetical protein